MYLSRNYQSLNLIGLTSYIIKTKILFFIFVHFILFSVLPVLLDVEF